LYIQFNHLITKYATIFCENIIIYFFIQYILIQFKKSNVHFIMIFKLEEFKGLVNIQYLFYNFIYSINYIFFFI